MSMPVILRRVAQREFDDAADHDDQRHAGLGADFIDEVNQTLTQVGNNPLLYAEVHHDIREALMHRFPYAVYYRVENNLVIIVAIVHTARDPAVWQSRS